MIGHDRALAGTRAMKKGGASSFGDDLGDDFLSSWKPGKLSGGGLDLDDSPPRPVAKAGKKFNFSNFDMDLDFDGGFNKLASFNIDLSGLDVPKVDSGCGSGTDAGSNDKSREKRKSPSRDAVDVDTFVEKRSETPERGTVSSNTFSKPVEDRFEICNDQEKILPAGEDGMDVDLPRSGDNATDGILRPSSPPSKSCVSKKVDEPPLSPSGSISMRFEASENTRELDPVSSHHQLLTSAPVNQNMASALVNIRDESKKPREPEPVSSVSQELLNSKSQPEKKFKMLKTTHEIGKLGRPASRVLLNTDRFKKMPVTTHESEPLQAASPREVPNKNVSSVSVKVNEMPKQTDPRPPPHSPPSSDCSSVNRRKMEQQLEPAPSLDVLNTDNPLQDAPEPDTSLVLDVIDKQDSRNVEKQQLTELPLAVMDVDDKLENEAVEKVESYSEVLENMCKMLRQKKEEATDLLARAIVANNKLLLLNSPVHDEKIQLLRRSVNELLAKD